MPITGSTWHWLALDTLPSSPSTNTPSRSDHMWAQPNYLHKQQTKYLPLCEWEYNTQASPLPPEETCQCQCSIWYPYILPIFYVFLFFNLRFQHSKEKQNYSTYPIILSMLRNRILASIEKNIFLLVCPKLECNKTQTFQQRRKKKPSVKGRKAKSRLLTATESNIVKCFFSLFPMPHF